MFISQDHYKSVVLALKACPEPKEPCSIRDKLNAIEGVYFVGIDTTKSFQVRVVCTSTALVELLKILRAITIQAGKEKPKLICDLYGESILTFDLYHIEDAKTALTVFEKAISERHFFSEESHFVNPFILGLDKARESEKLTNDRELLYVGQNYREAALSILDAMYAHSDLYTSNLIIADRGDKNEKFRKSLLLLCYPSQEGHAKYIRLYQNLRAQLRDKALLKLTYCSSSSGHMIAITMNMTSCKLDSTQLALIHCMAAMLSTIQKL